MKRKLFVFLIITLFTASAAMAGHHGPRGQKGFCGHDGQGMGDRPGMILQMADKLELSDSQITEVKKMMEKNGIDRIERKAELQKAQLELRHLKMNDAADTKILSAIDRIGKLKTEMRKTRFQHQSVMKSILTGEQTEKLKELRQEFRQGRGFHGRNHPGKGAGSGYNCNFDENRNNSTGRPGFWGN